MWHLWLVKYLRGCNRTFAKILSMALVIIICNKIDDDFSSCKAVRSWTLEWISQAHIMVPLFVMILKLLTQKRIISLFNVSFLRISFSHVLLSVTKIAILEYACKARHYASSEDIILSLYPDIKHIRKVIVCKFKLKGKFCQQI